MMRRLWVPVVLVLAALVGSCAKCPPNCVPKTGFRREKMPDGSVRFVRYTSTCRFVRMMSDSSSTDTTFAMDSSSTDTTLYAIDSVVFFVH